LDVQGDSSSDMTDDQLGPRLWESLLPANLYAFLTSEDGPFSNMPKAFSILAWNCRSWPETILAMQMFCYDVASELLDSGAKGITDEKVRK
jgi:hypothetical protein